MVTNMQLFSELDSLGDSTDVMISSLCSFQKFVPISIVKTLVESRQEAKLGVELHKCVIFFSDIENFTGHSGTNSDLQKLTEKKQCQLRHLCFNTQNTWIQ